MDAKIGCPVEEAIRRPRCQLGIRDFIKILLARGLGEYSSTLDDFCKEKKSVFTIILVFGIALGIYLGVYVAPHIELLNAKERALALFLGIALGICLGGRVSTLVEFLKERKRRPIAGHSESSHKTKIQRSPWIMDTGAKCHATGDLRLFSTLTIANQGSWVYGISGQLLPIRGFGTVHFPHFTLEEVYYVEGLGRNLISQSKFLLTFSYEITFGKSTYIKDEATGRRICELRTVEGLYELDSMPVAHDRTPAAEGRA